MVLAHERGDEGVLGVEGVDHGDLDSHGCEGVTESGDVGLAHGRPRFAFYCLKRTCVAGMIHAKYIRIRIR